MICGGYGGMRSGCGGRRLSSWGQCNAYGEGFYTLKSGLTLGCRLADLPSWVDHCQ